MNNSSQPHPLIKNPHLEGDQFFWQAGPTGILLIHGLTATTAEVRPLAKFLHSKGYTVSGPVLDGHNSVPDDLNRVHWRDWIATCEKAYRELASRCDRVLVGGESTGGLLALYLGSQHPEIAGILTYAPALKLSMSVVDQIKLHLMAPFVPYIPRTGPDDGLAWKGYATIHLRGAKQLLGLQKYVQPHLAEIRRPVLVIQGRRDTTVHPSVPDMIAAGVSSVVKEVHWLENSAHCVALDCEFEQLATLTLAFIEKIDG